VDEEEKVCPRCGAKLGDRLDSGIAARPGSPLLKIFFMISSLAIIGKVALHSRPDNPGSALVQISRDADIAKEGAIKKIKEKGADELGKVGVADIRYTDDTLCVYVDQRFSNLSRHQQEQLLSLVAGEWEKAIGKTSTAVKIVEYGTEKTLAELVV